MECFTILLSMQILPVVNETILTAAFETKPMTLFALDRSSCLQLVLDPMHL